MFSTLVSTEDLAAHLNDPDWIILDCRFTLSEPTLGREDWQKGHIPGAIYVHLDDDMSAAIGPDSGRHPLPDPLLLAAKLRNWGVNNDSQVVVYDDAYGSVAGRMWWLLRWLGHDKVALLDGVWQKWLREKRPTDDRQGAPEKGNFRERLNNELLINTEELLQTYQRPDTLIIDARAEIRFTGEQEPLDPVAGHIPGAINLPFDENLDLGSELLPRDELRELYQGILGTHAPDKVVMMCGSGVTACHNIIAMEYAGLHGARLYLGSWSEWIRDAQRPVATGEA